jgi:hypothetical protein
LLITIRHPSTLAVTGSSFIALHNEVPEPSAAIPLALVLSGLAFWQMNRSIAHTYSNDQIKEDLARRIKIPFAFA